MKQEGQTDLRWMDNSPKFDTLLKVLFALCIISTFVVKCSV